MCPSRAAVPIYPAHPAPRRLQHPLTPVPVALAL